MQLLEFNCLKCNYKVDLLVGTQEPDQTLSDLNEDFANYGLFLCPVDKTLQSININDREFRGDCPQHKVKLQPLTEVPNSCPKCGGPVQIIKKTILKPEVGE